MGGVRAAWFGVAVAAAAFGMVATPPPSYADDTVVVQGTSFPDPGRAGLSFVGCDDLYQRTDEPLVPAVGRGPGEAPAGQRSLGFDLGGGNAVGALFTVDSVLSTKTASVAVNAVDRARGVAYAGYQEPADAGTSLLWLGRSELTTSGGAWQTVEATTRSYRWTKYDMATQQAVTSGPDATMTVADFAVAHGGDGPGVFTIGFGCDGTAFSMDRLQVGAPGRVTTYDVEGLRTQVTIVADRPTVEPGEPVTLTGRLASETGDPVRHASLVLEQRRPGSLRWTPVAVAPVGPDGATARVEPDGPTFYRWRFVDRPLAEGSTSMPLLLDVLPPIPTGQPSPTGTPFPSPSPSGSPTSATSPSDPQTSDPPVTQSPSSVGSPTESIAPSSPSEMADGSVTPNQPDWHGAN